MTDKITSWPPNVAEWQTAGGRSLRLRDHSPSIYRTDDGWLLLNVTRGDARASVWDDHRLSAIEQVAGTSDEDAAIAGFNRLIELGIIKRRSTVSVDSSVDCDGPVDDSPTFTDNLE